MKISLASTVTLRFFTRQTSQHLNPGARNTTRTTWTVQGKLTQHLPSLASCDFFTLHLYKLVLKLCGLGQQQVRPECLNITCVRVGVFNSDYFDITSRLKQRDVLSFILSIVVVAWILKRTVDEKDGIEWVSTNRLAELAYAVDVTLLSEDMGKKKKTIFLPKTKVFPYPERFDLLNTMMISIFHVRNQLLHYMYALNSELHCWKY